MEHCQKCGARLEEDDEFCPECGSRIGNGKQGIQPTESIPAIEAERKLQQPKKHRFLSFVLIIIAIVFLAKACATFGDYAKDSEPYYETASYVPETSNSRIVTIPTPPPRETFPTPAEVQEPDRSEECRGVAAMITDACESSGFSVYDYFTVENTGSRPIAGFNARYYTDAASKDDDRLFAPIDIGASHQYYTYYGGVKMIEVVPIIVVDGEEVVCDNNIARYGNTYGERLPDCSAGGPYQGTETTPAVTQTNPSYGYDSTYDTG